MLDILRKVVNEPNQLVDVSYALFEGDLQFITSVELRFTSLIFNLQAVAEDDTLLVNFGALEPKSDESIIQIGNSNLWSPCKDAYIVWGWRLTNQQGYDDGLRLEFTKPKEGFNTVVEFIVAASAIQIFSAIRQK